MLWKEKDDVSINSFSRNHIDAEVLWEGNHRFRLTGIYREPNRNLRANTWRLLRELKEESTLPWCLIGDFNNVMDQSEKKGGNCYPNWLVEGFRATVGDCALQDLRLYGHPFTWEKGRSTPNWIEARLDRVLVSEEWLRIFHFARLFNYDVSPSDHTPLILDTNFRNRTQGNRRFRFENWWLSDPGCEEVVRSCWENNLGGSLQFKINKCGEALTEWGSEREGSFSRQLKWCNKNLKRLKGRSDEEGLQQYNETKKKLFEVLHQKEVYWKQRSKQMWLHDGDQNSKFFHARASARRRNNQIVRLKDENGVFVDWENGLDRVILDYFQGLFTASVVDWREVLSCVPSIVTDRHNSMLLQPVLDEEKAVVFQMHPDKSPGPDGMNPAFYQKYWHIVGGDVIHTVRNFFRDEAMQPGLNKTNVVLIPKKKCPDKMTELKPISLCNVLAKVITKVLANRMKGLLNDVISVNQSAFIPGRLITDNIMVSFEILHYLKRKQRGKDGFMALKLDMSKAYDRVEWSYICAMLSKMGFDEKWVRIISSCLSSVEYTVVSGSHEVGPIVPSRGLRQGDPISPYLFLVCAEGFSALIRKYEERRWIHGCKVANRAPVVSHMLFADGSYLYCKANDSDVQKVQQLLQIFEEASGQKVNFTKSSAFFSTNTSHQDKTHICQVLGIVEAGEDSKYLGLPSTLSRNKSAVFGYLKDRVRRKIQNWDGKLLSRAGKEILIKAVVQALPSYAMNVFQLPQDTCKDIEKSMCDFWWHSKSSQKNGIHWLSWKNLSKHKGMGGMGFRDLRDFNLALLGKQGWRLITNEDSLVARIFRARYYPNGHFLTAEVGANPSFIWRSVLASKDLIKMGIRKRIGSGVNVDILGEPWLIQDEDPFISSTHPALFNNKVSSLMKVGVREWDTEILEDVLSIRDQQLVLSVPLSSDVDSDGWYWSKEKHGFYTVKSGYNCLQEFKGTWTTENNSGFWRAMWQLKLPPKVKNFLWRTCSKCLPTKSQLRIRHVQLQTNCPWCNANAETSFHLFVQCPVAQACWCNIGLAVCNTQAVTFAAWFQAGLESWDAATKIEVSMLCWALWKYRNDKVWNAKSPTVDQIVTSAKLTLANWLDAQNRFQISSLNHEKHKFGVGMVARTAAGAVIEARQILHSGVVSPLLAEAVGIKEALSWIKNKRWSDLVLETDCLNVVHDFNSNKPMISPYGFVIKDCKAILEHLVNVSIVFVKRSANKVAHALARNSVLMADCTFSMATLPTDISSLVLDDLF
uniref:Reverse transcriptase domain-containing protein n=1 Tax=Cannabis sativa TaxID=3483 RepID=A0A803PKP8_CANSA